MAGNFAAEILQQRFAFKRIGISVTQEQQQMPMFTLMYTGRKGMPGHGVVITTHTYFQRLILGKYTILWSVSTEMSASRIDARTCFTTVSYLSKQCVNLCVTWQSVSRLFVNVR